MYRLYCFAEKPAEREDSSRKSDVQSSSEGQTLLQDSGKAVPQIPEGMEDRKGRYWNYEHNRWSYCEGNFINFIAKLLLDIFEYVSLCFDYFRLDYNGFITSLKSILPDRNNVSHILKCKYYRNTRHNTGYNNPCIQCIK